MFSEEQSCMATPAEPQLDQAGRADARAITSRQRTVTLMHGWEIALTGYHKLIRRLISRSCYRLSARHVPAIEIVDLSHRYGERLALDDLSLRRSQPAKSSRLLGPNGGGKTTLFRLLSTLIPLQRGRGPHAGPRRARARRPAVRRRIGVVFQAPSLDRKLTVAENLRHQGRLYGLSRRDACRPRATSCSPRLGLDRPRATSASKRSPAACGGASSWPRACCTSRGCCCSTSRAPASIPAARSDLWEYLRKSAAEHGVTVVLTTHLLEEADKADRIAILDHGRLVALGTPDELRATVGGDSITIETADAAAAGRGDCASASAARPQSSTAACGWKQPDGHAVDRRGWSRRFPAEIDSHHARQADAGRRVHRPHRPSVLDKATSAEERSTAGPHSTLIGIATVSHRSR